MKKRKTKIVCTIGPACEEPAVIKRLLEAGMNVARFNFSHGTHAEQKNRIETVLSASKETGIPVATLLDTKGPQLRTGATLNNEKIILKEGNTFTLTTDNSPGTNDFVSINHGLLPQEVSKGIKILIADGLLELEVLETSKKTITCQVLTGGSFGSNKNVNVLGAKISLPPVTEDDKKDIAFGASMNMDFIAASFIQTADDVRMVRHELEKNNSHMGIIAKIETHEALENIHSIVLTSKGIMVARGDLGVQLKTEEVPLAQKNIIRVCNQYGSAVITATQMLESMITNPRPTRAEATDVANAIFDGTDAIMLSAETASGKYPVEAVQTMHKIALNVEHSREYKEQSKRYFLLHKDVNNVGSAVAKSTCMLASDTNSSVIISPSLRGNSPRMLSQFRPPQVIVATTTNESIYRHLLIYWGVYPYLLSTKTADIEHIIDESIDISIRNNLVTRHDFVTITAGLPLGSPTMLNTTQVRFVGTILQRGSQGYGSRTEGTVYTVRDIAEARQYIKDKKNIILVCKTFDPEDFSLLRHARGIICSSYLRSMDDLVYKNPHIVVIADIHSKSINLKDGQYVGLSGTEKIVYETTSKDNELF